MDFQHEIDIKVRTAGNWWQGPKRKEEQVVLKPKWPKEKVP